MWLSGEGTSDAICNFKWCKWILNKCNIFMWKACMDRIPTMWALRRRNIMVGDGRCVFCGDVDETTDHIFTTCRLASGVWSGIASWCNLSPNYLFSISDVLQVINQMDGSKKKKEIVHGVLVLTCWRIWKERNEKNLINNDVNVVQIVSDVKSLGYLWYRSRFKDGTVDWKGWCRFSFEMM
ncbi:putative reverse transcriptase zinc-binding domain-containing protein [Helianthus annuus]|nr:putative reverse transcriptase zinc-binding domain-containing protein [Helianthus annuus]